jgi:hypothetical protein
MGKNMLDRRKSSVPLCEPQSAPLDTFHDKKHLTQQHLTRASIFINSLPHLLPGNHVKEGAEEGAEDGRERNALPRRKGYERGGA